MSLRERPESAMNPSTKPKDKIDLGELSRRIGLLMTNYCDAFSACGKIPALSLWPLPTLYFKGMVWMLCFEIWLFLLVPVNIILFFVRRIFGRPKLVIGSRLNAVLVEPLQSVWKGEVSAFKIIRLRYLTRLLLFYRAQSKINALHRVFNRQQLDLLTAGSRDKRAIAEAEKFQKTFDLFQKITTDTYQIGALAIGGPLVALLTIAVQKGFLPLVNFVWKYFGSTWEISPELIGTLEGFLFLFVIVAIWILVSAWMDMRSLIAAFGIPEIECDIYEYARIKLSYQIPFDILLYVGLMSINFGYTYFQMWRDPQLWRDVDLLERYYLIIGNVLGLTFVVGLGLVALQRRHSLSRRTSAKAVMPAVTHADLR